MQEKSKSKETTSVFGRTEAAFTLSGVTCGHILPIQFSNKGVYGTLVGSMHQVTPAGCNATSLIHKRQRLHTMAKSS